MKKFLINFFAFLIPILLIFGIAEHILRKNHFQAKKEYIQNHKNDIEVMITGPSHAEIGINPELIDHPTVNFATSSGFMKIDKAVIERYINDFPKLKLIIVSFPAGYLEPPSPPSFPRRSLYNIYYDVGYDNPSISDNFLLTSSFRLSVSSLKQSLLNNYKPQYNEFGFPLTIQENYNLFKKLHYDDKLISEDKKLENQFKLYNKLATTGIEENTKLLEEIISLCRTYNKKMVLISLPKYHYFNKRVPTEFYSNREMFLQNHSKDSLIFWNFDTWNEKSPKYFKDFNHLNPEGAEAFTKVLNDSIAKIIH